MRVKIVNTTIDGSNGQPRSLQTPFKDQREKVISAKPSTVFPQSILITTETIISNKR